VAESVADDLDVDAVLKSQGGVGVSKSVHGECPEPRRWRVVVGIALRRRRGRVCPPDLVPYFVRSADERDRWQTCWELSLKMLGGEDLGGWRPILARHLYQSDIPTG
jgi:hypothetical protein